MSLAAGSRLGPYEILGPLGAGGMGEVYRARDARLGREVALKVLPAELSEDRDRLSRFEQEARSASALNHPNIVTVHDIGISDSTSYIAMELVDGKTLRELVVAGAMPVRRVLAIACQIADGLAKAHAAGIVHRDLKPENVMVSKDGFVKILDFGLAKLVEPQSGGVSVMPTLARPETHPGVVMGTVGYMSPEQASGEPLDFRSDQFSFGSILYEVATGQKPFQRKTAAETMSAIIREDPEPIGKAHPEVPPPLRWIVDRCLAKDPEERYVSTRDLARELAGVRDHVSEIASGAEASIDLGPRPLRRARRSMVLSAALLLLLGGAVAGWLFAAKRLPKTTTAPTFQRITFRSVFLNNARFSPDGQTVVYASQAAAGFNPRLFAARVGSPESRPFDMEADILSISSAGEMAVLLDQNLLFGTLARVPFAGGAPRPVVVGVGYAGADWSPDGKNLAIVRTGQGKDRLEYPIGKVLLEGSIGAPRFSPRGDRIAYQEAPGSIAMIASSGGQPQTLTSGWQPFGGGAPCWSPDGKEVWFTASREASRPNTLQAVDLDGKVRLVAEMPGSLELDDISRDGRLLLAHHTLIHSLRARAGPNAPERDLTWLDASLPFDISADGKTIFFSEFGEGGGPKGGVYMRKLDDSAAIRLGEGRGLSVSPDGATVLAAMPPAAEGLALLPVGVGQSRGLPVRGFEQFFDGEWLRDGKAFVFAAREPGKRRRIYRFDLATGKVEPAGPEGAGFPPFLTGRVSPDGRWLLGATGSGGFARYPVAGGAPRPVSGLQPLEMPIRWTADSRTIFTRTIGEGGTLRIWRLDPDTGRRTLVEEIRMPEDGASVDHVVMTADRSAIAYMIRRVHSQLYVVEGLR
jgi:eukaryotic-like serine/threonine-protein kinase